MVRYKVIRPYIFLEAYEIISLGDISETRYKLKDSHFRECLVEKWGKVEVFETKERPLQRRDLVRYDATIDDYALFDIHEVAPGVKIVEVDATEPGKDILSLSTHIRF